MKFKKRRMSDNERFHKLATEVIMDCKRILKLLHFAKYGKNKRIRKKNIKRVGEALHKINKGR